MRSFLVHTTKLGRPVKGKRAAGHNGGRKVDPKRRKKQLAEEAAVEAAQLNQEKVFSSLPSPPSPPPRLLAHQPSPPPAHIAHVYTPFHPPALCPAADAPCCAPFTRCTTRERPAAPPLTIHNFRNGRGRLW